MSDQIDAYLVEQALLMALGYRSPDPDGLIFHSDRGCQFTSHLVQSLLRKHPIQVSMSGVGNCYDNAPAESFFGTLKAECVTARFATRSEARRAIFEYIEVWYNRQRLHSTIGYLPPVEFERQYFYPLKSVR
jgi:putative transposase